MRFRLQAYTPKFNPKTDTERELRNCFEDMLLITRALENHFESRHPGHEAPKIIRIHTICLLSDERMHFVLETFRAKMYFIMIVS